MISKIKTGIATVLTVLACFYHACAADFSFARTYTNDLPGEAEVSLSIVFNGTGTCHAVEERLPGPMVTNGVPSANGVYLAGRHAIRWEPFLTSAGTTLTYRVSAPEGCYEPEGSVWMDGVCVYAMTGTPVTIGSPGTVSSPPSQVASPVFSPAGSTNLPVEVAISCATTGAVVRYTVDGSVPSETSLLYTGAVTVAESTVIRARGFVDGWTASAVANARFEVSPECDLLEITRTVTAVTGETAQVTLAGIDEGSNSNVNCCAYEEHLPVGVSVSNITENGVWDSTNRVIRWGPFVGTNNPALLSYVAYGTGGAYQVSGRWSINGYGEETAGVLSLPYPEGADVPPVPPLQVAVPVLLPSFSTNLPVDVSITNTTAGAEIRYTLDGSTPTALSSLYSGAIHIASGTVLRARAFKDDLTPSAAVVGRYEVPPAAGDEYLTLTRSISGNGSVLPDVSITATVFGSEPQSYSVTETLPTGLAAYEVGQDGVWDATNHTVKWGPFDDGQSRVLTYQVSGTSGRYTLDGTGSANGLPVDITGDVSAVVDLTTMEQVASPAFSPGPETGRFPVDVTISCATPDAMIYYTTDGSVPDETSVLYTEPVRLYSTVRLRARAYKEWMLPSVPVEGYYSTERLAGTPTIIRTVGGSGTSDPVIWLDVTPTEDTLCYSVSEVLPEGVTPDDITENGRWNATSRTLKWGPFLDKSVRRLTYRPSGSDGIYTLTGSGSFNGHPAIATGDKIVQIENHLFAQHSVSGSWTFSPEQTLSLVPPSGVHCHAVEEYLPDGITPTNINYGGVWNAVTHTIKWGPFEDTVARDFNFTLSADYHQFETYSLVSLDGVSRIVQRDLLVTVGLPAPGSVLAMAGNGVVYLEWEPCGYENGFILRQWTQPDRSDQQIIDLGPNSSGFYEIQNLTNGTTYFFALTAYDVQGAESAESAVVTAVPDANAGIMGAVTFDSGYYAGTGDVATVTVFDIDLNTDTEVVETVAVQVSSSSDPVGISLLLYECSVNTGRFNTVTGNTPLEFTFGASDAGNYRLHVSEGDIITVTYSDALPVGMRTATAQFAQLDADGDGINDSWERENFGGYLAAGANSDWDGDGMTDLDEWYGGYDPCDPESVLELYLPEFLGNGTILIQWRSVSGGTYILEKSTDLSEGFYPLLENVPAFASTNTCFDVIPLETNPVFYRIRLP